MTQEIINIGAVPNDGEGDPLRTAFQKINNNFTQLYLFIFLKKTVKTPYITANCYSCAKHSFKIDPCTPKRKIPGGAISLATGNLRAFFLQFF